MRCLAPWPGIEPGPPVLGARGFLVTGPPRKSLMTCILTVPHFFSWRNNYKTTHHINQNSQWRHIYYALESGLPFILLFSLSLSLFLFLLHIFQVKILCLLRGIPGRTDYSCHPSIHPSFQHNCVSLYLLSHFNCVLLFVTPWTVAHQVPLSMGFSKARILEWVAVSSSGGASRPRNQTSVS